MIGRQFTESVSMRVSPMTLKDLAEFVYEASTLPDDTPVHLHSVTTSDGTEYLIKAVSSRGTDVTRTAAPGPLEASYDTTGKAYEWDESEGEREAAEDRMGMWEHFQDDIYSGTADSDDGE